MSVEELTTLVSRAQVGDVEAYGQIVRRFQDMAYGYAYSLLGDFHLAEDAAQEAFVQASRDLGALKEPAAFPGWFRRIVFKYADRMRRGRRAGMVPLDLAEQVPSPGQEPSRTAEEREMADKVLEAIAALPDDQRTATTLFYINGYSQKDIADFLDVPVTTVNGRLAGARKRLKQGTLTMVEQTLHSNAPDERFSAAVIEEITESQSPHMSQMRELFDELFPELFPGDSDARPYFRELLGDRLDDQSRHTAQLFTSVADGRVVGIAQIFYRLADDGLIAWLDWLGVTEAARRRGIGSTLFAQTVAATREVAREYGVAPMGVASLVIPGHAASLGLCQALGVQVRDDLVYDFDGDGTRGDERVVWYPLADQYSGWPSVSLAWQLWQFGGLPAEEFARRYGKPD